MRIGEFSKKHNITYDTVRHYIDMGLLILKRNGHHYRFDDSHSRDMDKIRELKNLNFSLLEIQSILNFNRLAGESSKEYKNYYLNTLEKKKIHILEFQEKYKEIEWKLNKKIEEAETKGKDSEKVLGININFLEILYCPKCNKSLNISGGNIENNMITNGVVLCTCNYKARIENGIYIGSGCGENLSKRKKIPSKLDFMEGSSTEFINFYYDGMSEMIEKMKDDTEDPKYILELEDCSGTFLMQYIENLSEETTYILINNDKERLEEVKNNLELNSSHNRFIFICEEFDCLPIKANSIDVIVDHWMTKDYAFENHEFLLDKLSKLLKLEGTLIGSYPFLTNLERDIYIEDLKEKGYFDSKYISEKMKALGLKENSIKRIGPIIEKNPYNKEIKDRKLYSNIYSGIKANTV